ncbi:MAG: hypothetical protein RL272_418 [Candidatus Parcubacteria bacterium]|jgi:hypothetical protein
MRKHRAASGTPRRTYWKETAGSLVFAEIDYGTGAQGPRRALVRVPDERDGMFISSLCESGLHAPTLDIDFHVQVTNARFGRPIVCFGREVAKAAHVRLLEAFRDSGLSAPSWSRAAIGRVATGPAAAAKPEIECRVPMRVLPSSTAGHFHLYIDAELPQPAHAALLAALHGAGIIGGDFHAMSERDGMSLLIKPGSTKRDLAPRQPAATRWESSY